MSAVSLDNAIVATGLLADAGILSILAYKGRWRRFPAFSALFFIDVLTTGTLAVFPPGSGQLSDRLYFGWDTVNFLCQLAIVLEIVKVVLKPTGTWARKAKRLFLLFVFLGAGAAALGAFTVSPPHINGTLLLAMRGDIFASLLTCEAVVSMMLAANEVGLPWKSHVMAIGQGLMAWALSIVAIEGFASYLPQNSWLLAKIYYVRVFIYLGAVAYWSVSLWHEEPARKPISPALRKYIVALHDQVHYDLGKTGH